MIGILALIGIGIAGSMFISSDENEYDTDASDNYLEVPDDAEVTVSNGNAGDLFDIIEPIEDEADLATTVIEDIKFSDDFLAERNLMLGSDSDDFLDGSAGQLANSTDHLFGGAGDDHLVGGKNDVFVGGVGQDIFEVAEHGEVHILDLEEDEFVVVRYSGIAPEITGDATDGGTSILADGYPIAHLDGVYEFDFDRVVLSKVA